VSPGAIEGRVAGISTEGMHRPMQMFIISYFFLQIRNNYTNSLTKSLEFRPFTHLSKMIENSLSIAYVRVSLTNG